MTKKTKKFQAWNDYLASKKVKSISVNESMIDTLKTTLGNVALMFKDPTKLKTQIDEASTKAGDQTSVIPNSVKAGSTILVKLSDSDEESKTTVLALTCLAVMSEGSGLYQISGTDSAEFLGTLGIASNDDLINVGVIAIVGKEGFINDQPLTIRIYKNIIKDGKPVVTKNLVQATLPAEDVAKEIGEAPSADTGEEPGL